MRQWPFVLEHLSKIAAVDPTVAGRAADEVLGLACRCNVETLADVLSARDHRTPTVENEIRTLAALAWVRIYPDAK